MRNIDRMQPWKSSYKIIAVTRKMNSRRWWTQLEYFVQYRLGILRYCSWTNQKCKSENRMCIREKMIENWVRIDATLSKNHRRINYFLRKTFFVYRDQLVSNHPCFCFAQVSWYGRTKCGVTNAFVCVIYSSDWSRPCFSMVVIGAGRDCCLNNRKNWNLTRRNYNVNS